MAFFDWDPKYSVGIESIDQQHQHLFKLTSDFYDSIRNKRVKEAMSTLLQGLISYAGYHFDTEEQYMQQYHYPLYDRHVAQHGKFVEKVTDFQARFQNGELVIPIEIADFLKDWLAQHVLEEDQRYASFFQDKGLR